MRQKHIEIKRLGGRVEEELALGDREGKQIFFHCQASLNTAGSPFPTNTHIYAPTYQPGTFSVHFRVRNLEWVVVVVQTKRERGTVGQRVRGSMGAKARAMGLWLRGQLGVWASGRVPGWKALGWAYCGSDGNRGAWRGWWMSWGWGWRYAPEDFLKPTERQGNPAVWCFQNVIIKLLPRRLRIWVEQLHAEQKVEEEKEERRIYA